MKCKCKTVRAFAYQNGAIVAEGQNDCRPFLGICWTSHFHESQLAWKLCRSKHAEEGLAKELIEHLLGAAPFGGLKPDYVLIKGHYYACEPCARLLKSLGVKEIRVRET
jgi:deoxycytidylate deaminase